VIDLLGGSALKLSPVASLHELGVEHSNKGDNFVHVGDTFLKVHETLPFADDFVLWVARLSVSMESQAVFFQESNCMSIKAMRSHICLSELSSLRQSFNYL
jgi:hypothetical protein